jgi:hypothetical protein
MTEISRQNMFFRFFGWLLVCSIPKWMSIHAGDSHFASTWTHRACCGHVKMCVGVNCTRYGHAALGTFLNWFICG